ncbi:MAG: vWA domain-containing protein [Candidatus Electronema sp. V4]|uniref:vWA domain-containing protein n=1 Tax=Candidatus Electronema sp. V4 TaxID=3454756 RepID=UPI00405588CC
MNALKITPLLLAAAALSCLLPGCEDRPAQHGSSSAPQTNPTTQAAPQQAAAEAAAAKPAAAPWPPAPAGDMVLAPNLLAANYYVVLDGSGSMTDKQCSGGTSKMEAAKNALKEFAASVPAEANLGLLAFTESRIRELVPLGGGNRKQFAEAVTSVAASGETPLRSAITSGYAKLEAQAMRQLGYGRYILVVVTDGEASMNEDPRAQVSWMLASTSVELHTIGFCIGQNHSLNMPGRTMYKAADNPAALRQGLVDVLAEAETFDTATFEAQ